MRRGVLIVADAADPLARRVHELLPQAHRCGERGLLAQASLTLDAAGVRVHGTLPVRDGVFALARLRGLVYRPRPPGRRAPRPAGLAQAFARHERRAALSSLFAALPGVVLNCLPPGWFMDEALYRAVLARRLAAALGLGLQEAAHGAERSACSVYLALGTVVAADAAALPACEHLDPRGRSVARRLLAEGLGLLRLDLVSEGGGFSLASADPAPTLAESPLVERLAHLVADRFS